MNVYNNNEKLRVVSILTYNENDEKDRNGYVLINVDI